MVATSEGSGITSFEAEIGTAGGPGQVEVDQPESAAFLVVMTHGAAGGAGTKDLLAVRDAALARGAAVAQVLQPYRVRGARAPGARGRRMLPGWRSLPPSALEYPGIPLIQGGRSNGARVACRTAAGRALLA